ncbi:MAG TPA: Maf family protein [Vicinamibacterales bacterium]|nr:Maf family protein [Vicinamibacterales bacterium]
MRLVLASSSPRRAELLAAAGFAFDINPADVDERVHPGELPRHYVERLALEKSAATLDALDRVVWRNGDPAASAARDVIVIGADTAVIVDNVILGKPIDAADAERMLRRLSGRAHLVLTGVSLRSRTRQAAAIEETRVFVRPLSDAQIAWYVESGEGMDKAGAYAIQGLASRFIPRIEGSYSNVVGLPVARIAELLDGFG